MPETTVIDATPAQFAALEDLERAVAVAREATVPSHHIPDALRDLQRAIDRIAARVDRHIAAEFGDQIDRPEMALLRNFLDAETMLRDPDELGFRRRGAARQGDAPDCGPQPEARSLGGTVRAFVDALWAMSDVLACAHQVSASAIATVHSDRAAAARAALAVGWTPRTLARQLGASPAEVERWCLYRTAT